MTLKPTRWTKAEKDKFVQQASSVSFTWFSALIGKDRKSLRESADSHGWEGLSGEGDADLIAFVKWSINFYLENWREIRAMLEAKEDGSEYDGKKISAKDRASIEFIKAGTEQRKIRILRERKELLEKADMYDLVITMAVNIKRLIEILRDQFGDAAARLVEDCVKDICRVTKKAFGVRLQRKMDKALEKVQKPKLKAKPKVKRKTKAKPKAKGR